VIGDGDLPEKSSIFMIAFAIVFGCIAAIKTFASSRQLSWAKWVPSGVAFAIGFLNTPPFSIARLIGGVIELYYRSRFNKDGKAGDIRLIVIASGFVLGEGVISVVTLILRTFGVGVLSCGGCGHGLCSGCS
jgi:uncharacterized oligopeptide transporter (OPT) family protein